MLENQEGTDRGSGPALRTRGGDAAPGGEGPGSPRRRLRVPRALVFALLGAAVGVGVFLVERPGGSGSLTPAEANGRPGRRDLHREPRSLQRGGLPAGRDVEQAARQVERQRVISESALRQLRHLRAPPEVAGEWSAYLMLREVQISRLEQARAAAVAGDNLAYQRAQRKLAEGRHLRFEAARRVGLRECSRGA